MFNHHLLERVKQSRCSFSDMRCPIDTCYMFKKYTVNSISVCQSMPLLEENYLRRDFKSTKLNAMHKIIATYHFKGSTITMGW